MELSFFETMSGKGRWLSEKGSVAMEVSFDLEAVSAQDRFFLRSFITDEGAWHVRGTLSAGEALREVRCEGTIEVNLLRSRKTMRYVLHFQDEHGERYRLVGEKHRGWFRWLHGLTTLHSEMIRDRDQAKVWVGQVCFDLRTLGAWLRSWRIH